MTEIKVQHKEHRRGAKWPWLLLLLIPLAWFALRDDDDRTEVDRAGAVDTTTYVAPANAGATTTASPATGTAGTAGNPR